MNNYGNNAQTVHGDQVLNNHYHFYPQNNASDDFGIIIDEQKINNLETIEIIVKKLLKLKVSCLLKNTQQKILVETIKLTRLLNAFNSTQNTHKKNDLVEKIIRETNICKHASCFFDYVIKDYLPLKTIDDYKVFQATLHLILNNNTFSSPFFYATEVQQIYNFLTNIEIIKSSNNEFLNSKKALHCEREPDDGVGFYLGTEEEYEKAASALYLKNLEHELKLKEDLEIEKLIHSLKVEFANLNIWLYLPFCTSFITKSGVKFSTFNHRLVTTPKQENYNTHKFVNDFYDEDYPEDYIKILSRFYSRISFLRFQSKSDDVFVPEIILREIDFDPMQKELREIFKKYDNLEDSYWKYNDFSNIHNDWRDKMLNLYGYINLGKNKI